MIKEGKFWRCQYWGLLQGKVGGYHREGVISMPLRDGLPSTDGVPSITQWKIIKFNGERGNREHVSLIQFEPRTAVDDQIRIHCTLSLNAPLIDDVGLHLYQVSGCLPGGDHTVIVAPPKGLFREKLVHLGFM
jgi:hypothetical protein